jgi:SAM-dependent methyltransferase
MNFSKNSMGYFAPKNREGLKISYPLEGNENCLSIEEQPHWFNARNQVILASIEQFSFEGDFLDVGGGNGYQLLFLENYFKRKGIKSALCEPGSQGCANAAQMGLKNVYCCQFSDSPFKFFNIGAIGLLDVLEHIDDDVQFLKNIKSVLPIGGRIYITVPAMKFLFSDEDRFGGYFRRFNKKECSRVASGSGLKIISQTYFFSFYVPLVWLFRVFLEKININLSREKTQKNELNYHKKRTLLNAVLNLLHLIEMRLAKIGCHIPFGTSMLIILEK